ncbi:TIGR04222 domain-containing membrane protein [Streptomyces sp. NPDC051173]|uniref:TIGR04222 domain-containing membrane protein n=1 Tax=Streptomyces sp. NPDC051173 TaxID=3155164 RepID=UPI00344E3CCA
MITAWAIALAVAAATVALPSALLVRSRRRAIAPTRTGSGTPGLLEVACLTGGPLRVAETVITVMDDDGRITATTDGLIKVLSPVTYDPVERALLKCCGDRWFCTMRGARMALLRAPAVRDIQSALVSGGLLAPPGPDAAGRRAERLHTAGLTAAALMASALLLATRTYPVPCALLACVACGVALRLAVRVRWSRATPAGRRAARAEHPCGAPGKVALEGPSALPDSVLRDQLLRAAKPERASESSGNGGGGSTNGYGAMCAFPTCSSHGPACGSHSGYGGGCGGGF